MRSLKYLLLLTILFTIHVNSQNKLFTVEDIVFNSFPKLAPANLLQFKWLEGSDKFVYVEGVNANQALLISNVKSSKPDTLLKLQELNNSLSNSGFAKVSTFPVIDWEDASSFNFWSANNRLSYDTKKKTLKKINAVESGAENRSISPDSKYIAFTKSNNLFVTLEEQKTIQITNEVDTSIICGQAVHRNEFGINEGIFWSPKSNYIAFYRMDQTMVTDYPLVDLSTIPGRLKNTKYPMAGQTSHHVTVGIFEISTGKTTWLKTGEPLDQYLTSLTWSPDEKYFFVAHLNRDQNHMVLKKYNAANGELVKSLFEEKDNKYVEPENPLYFLPNNNNNKFLWFSERDGFNHLYLYDVDGNLLKQITKGSWVVTELNGVDKSGQNIFITATKETPLERHVYKINLQSGKTEQLTKETGTHSVFISSTNDYYVDSYSSQDVPRKIDLYNKNGKIIKNIFTAEDPLKEYKLGEKKIFSIKNNEGIDLYCRLIYPPDFDSTKKYPVIVYIYGGPHSQGITNSFGYGRYHLWYYMMAQKGYIVFELDNRGTANRGLDFEQATFRRLGTIEVEDQMTGVNYLKTLPYVDADRFGVYGWSYGGFMTTSLMLRTNGAFKVGACGGAVIDWKFYEIMYTERYMDTPLTNPEGYKESSLLNYVENLNGKLLLVHGTEDPTVVWQNTLLFSKRATELNKPLDYFPYIGHGHGVRGIDALHLYNKFTNYFLDNL